MVTLACFTPQTQAQWIRSSVCCFRKSLILCLHALLIIVAYYGSFLFRFDFQLLHPERHGALITLPVVLAVQLTFFSLFGLLSGSWRHVGVRDLRAIAGACLCSALLLFVIIEWVWQINGFARSIFAIDLVLSVVVVGGARLAVRTLDEARRCGQSKSVLIVGAGRAGSAVARELQNNPGLGLRPVGFVDDDAKKHGLRINGLRVLGPSQTLPKFLEDFRVGCVLIAIPSASGRVVERIIDRCRNYSVEFKILSPIQERLHEPGQRVDAVRDVRVEDLLGREPVRIDDLNVRRALQNKVLLITGAGGSIGSELVRQTARFGPRKVVLLDRSENDLFKVSLELSATFPELEFVCAVCDILDVSALRDIFGLHQPAVVFHAAAYKHVPMMECNCFQAVVNNVFGTYNVALVARQFAAENFVMISSDKAVRPTNVMGVTKRVAELVVLSLRPEHTRFVAVRFGNVLGSNGSVLPVFRQQIANGGPVTVTHPDAERYFMTIPEAAQLVLQASSMGRGGEIFVLDMGEPMKILELARKLIRFSGLSEKDIKIIFTGLRPGEKLSEELMLDDEGLQTTTHPKIRVLEGTEVRFDKLRGWLDELTAAVEAKNVDALISALRRIVPQYQPSAEILSLCQFDRHDMVLRYKQARALLESPESYAA